MGENKMSLRDFIQKSDDYFIEARDKEVSAEFRIALGKLKGIYGNDEVPTSKVLEKDIEMIIKKYNLDVSFKEYAKKNIKINESEEIEVISESMKVINKIQKLLPKTDLHIGKDGPNKEYVWTFKDYSFIRVSSSETYNRIEYYTKGGDFITSFLTVGELKSYLKSSNLLTESAVGEVGRTSKADAEAHITPELKAEFEKIIRQIGGKAVARALLDGNPDNGEISESADYSDFLSEKEVGYMVYGFGDEDDFKRVQKKFFGNGLVWGRDGSKDIKDTKVLKQLDIKSFDDLALYNEGKDMYLGNKATLYKRKDLKKIEASDIK
jgi:galactitol-specific phosphotransferase system IIB component